MPDLTAAIAYIDQNISRPNLREIIQPTTKVSSVSEDERTYHAGICSTSVSITDVIVAHDLSTGCAGYFVLVSAWGFVCPLDSTGWPVLFNLAK